MSLINIRNLSAPIRSKVQIGGLIIVALLVLVIRYGTSAGGFSSTGIRRQDGKPAAGTVLGGSQSQQDLLDFLDEAPAPRKPAGADQDDSLVDELVSGRFDRQQKQRQQEQEKNESFQDIRRSLGLE